MISLKRRALAALGVIALVASACGGTSATATPATSGQPPASGGAATPAPPSAAAVGDFTFVVDSEPTTLATEPDDLPTSWIVAEIYSTLYQPNYKVEYVPFVAAAAPETSADGLTWTVKLRDGVKFHDGSTLSSADVKFSYDLHLSKNCRGNPDTCSVIGDNVSGVDAPDASTLVFHLKQKFAPFLATGLGTVLILPKAAVEASFQRFQEAAKAVTQEEVQALVTKIDTATGDAACSGDTPPDTCKYATYTADVEALLAKAGIETLNKAQFNTAGDNGDQFDPEAYAQGIKGQLDDLNRTLGATEIDQIAAAQKIIDFGKNPIGSGPYKFVKYNAGQNVELARFDDYFGGTTGVDPQKIPAKAFAVVIRSSAAATAALGNDEIQWQQKIESDAYTTVKDNPNVQIAEYPDNGYYYLAFNLREGHLYADKALREAFSMCIDHDKTVEVATSGNGVPVFANTPPFSWAYNPNVAKYTLDVAGAKAKIEGAGWKLGSDGIYAKGGKRLSSTLYVRVGRPQRLAFAQLARDQLKECGIEVEVQEGDLNTVLIPKVLDYPNDFDTYLGGWSTALGPDDYSIFHSSEIPTKDVPSANNFPGWKNPQADQLLEAERQELDQAKRKDLLFQFQTLIHDELPYYFLWADKAHTGLSKRVVSQNEPFDMSSVGINYYNIDAWTVTPK
ncbi:MAG TPA: ABC transporter substrate-binding protein [Candidatus Limnocylindrales bacterium]